MSNPTSNFGWQMPTATDLVTDLPADFEVFGQAVDTDFADLNGGTTGQILSKTSATDLDFTWINNDQGDITGVTAGTGISGGGTSGTVTVTNSMATAIDAKGDLIAGTGADAFSRLAIGSNATVLTADSAEATGMKWATLPSAGKVLQVVQATTSTSTNVASTTFADTTLTASITPSLATSKVLVMVSQLCAFDRDGADQGMAIKLLRGATDIYVPAGTSDPRRLYFTSLSSLGAPQGISFRTMISFSYLDSPSTTSSTTYKTQQAVHTISNSGSSTTQAASGTSTILLLEIGA